MVNFAPKKTSSKKPYDLEASSDPLKAFTFSFKFTDNCPTKDILDALEKFVGEKVFSHVFKYASFGTYYKYNKDWEVEPRDYATINIYCNAGTRDRLVEFFSNEGFTAEVSLQKFNKESF